MLVYVAIVKQTNYLIIFDLQGGFPVMFKSKKLSSVPPTVIVNYIIASELIHHSLHWDHYGSNAMCFCG